MADGIIRASRFEGAKQAYLPIIGKRTTPPICYRCRTATFYAFGSQGREGSSGVSIAMSRLGLGSSQWSSPVILAQHPGWSDQNPVPFRAPDGKLWLFHTSQQAGKGQTTAIVYDLTSNDLGSYLDRSRSSLFTAGYFYPPTSGRLPSRMAFSDLPFGKLWDHHECTKRRFCCENFKGQRENVERVRSAGFRRLSTNEYRQAFRGSTGCILP